MSKCMRWLVPPLCLSMLYTTPAEKQSKTKKKGQPDLGWLQVMAVQMCTAAMAAGLAAAVSSARPLLPEAHLSCSRHPSSHSNPHSRTIHPPHDPHLSCSAHPSSGWRHPCGPRCTESCRQPRSTAAVAAGWERRGASTSVGIRREVGRAGQGRAGQGRAGRSSDSGRGGGGSGAVPSWLPDWLIGWLGQGYRLRQLRGCRLAHMCQPAGVPPLQQAQQFPGAGVQQRRAAAVAAHSQHAGAIGVGCHAGDDAWQPFCSLLVRHQCGAVPAARHPGTQAATLSDEQSPQGRAPPPLPRREAAACSGAARAHIAIAGHPNPSSTPLHTPRHTSARKSQHVAGPSFPRSNLLGRPSSCLAHHARQPIQITCRGAPLGRRVPPG